MPDDDYEDESNFWRQQRNGRTTPADIDAMRLDAGAVMCPDCHAPIDSDCINTASGQPLRHLPCHPKRLTSARKASS
jgi:uncharacterized protein (UPF0212 family)